MSRTFSERGFAYETSRPASGYRVQGSGCRVQDVQLAVQLLPLHFAGQRRKPQTLNPKPQTLNPKP